MRAAEGLGAEPARSDREHDQRRCDEGDNPPKSNLAAQTATIDEIIGGGCGQTTSPLRLGAPAAGRASGQASRRAASAQGREAAAPKRARLPLQPGNLRRTPRRSASRGRFRRRLGGRFGRRLGGDLWRGLGRRFDRRRLGGVLCGRRRLGLGGGAHFEKGPMTPSKKATNLSLISAV